MCFSFLNNLVFHYMFHMFRLVFHHQTHDICFIISFIICFIMCLSTCRVCGVATSCVWCSDLAVLTQVSFVLQIFYSPILMVLSLFPKHALHCVSSRVPCDCQLFEHDICMQPCVRACVHACVNVRF